MGFHFFFRFSISVARSSTERKHALLFKLEKSIFSKPIDSLKFSSFPDRSQSLVIFLQIASFSAYCKTAFSHALKEANVDKKILNVFFCLHELLTVQPGR